MASSEPLSSLKVGPQVQSVFLQLGVLCELDRITWVSLTNDVNFPVVTARIVVRRPMLALMLPHNGRVLSQPHIAVRDGGDLDGRQRQAVLRNIQGRCTQHKTIETAAGSEIDDPLAGLEGTHRERVSQHRQKLQPR